MFVEHITIYNFDIDTEMPAFKEYRKLLKGWECVEKGTKIISLEKHESVYVEVLPYLKEGESE